MDVDLVYCLFVVVLFFKQKTAYEMRISDWSSDVCSSDLDEKVASSASVSEVQNGPGAGQVRWSGSGGNPKLRPYIAVGTDLAWEKYFDDATYVGIDVFNKNILNYIYTRTVIDYDFSGYTNNNPLLTPDSNIGTFSTPQNGTGGRMQGDRKRTRLTSSH